MKKLMLISAISLLVGCCGCAGLKGYQTLGTIETTGNSAYKTYMQLVVSGQASTNDVPTVARAYNAFQATMIRAIIYAQNNTNALASPDAQLAVDVLAQKIATAQASK